MKNKLGTTKRPMGQAGMTLIEIIIVMAILTGIGVAIFAFVGGQQEEANAEATRQKMTNLSARMLTWKQRNRGKKCPSNIKELTTGKEVDRKEQIMDAWGNDMKIECGTGSVKFISPGSDGQFGNSDDVTMEK